MYIDVSNICLLYTSLEGIIFPPKEKLGLYLGLWKPKNHFSSCDIGYNFKNKKVILYLNLPSAIQPVLHSAQIPVPVPPETLDDPSDDSDLNAKEQNKDQEFQCEEDDKSP